MSRDLVPRDVTAADLGAWNGERVIFGPTKEGVGKGQLQTIRTADENGHPIVAIPFTIDEISLAALAQGATVWLLIWGEGMPPVCITTEAG